MGGIGKGNDTSDGNTIGSGDQGDPKGNPYSNSYYGGTSGGGGRGYGLSGRNLRNKGSVTQQCNEEGRVVVKIIVDRTGKLSKPSLARGLLIPHPVC